MGPRRNWLIQEFLALKIPFSKLFSDKHRNVDSKIHLYLRWLFGALFVLSRCRHFASLCFLPVCVHFNFLSSFVSLC